MTRPRELLAALILSAAAVPAWPAAAPLPIDLPTGDGLSRITGQIDLPKDETCAADPKKAKLPFLLLVPGTGKFDRDVVFGSSGTPRDLLFRDLSETLAGHGIAVARFDSRGVRCNPRHLPEGVPASEFESRCVDAEARKAVTPETIRADIQAVFDHVRSLPCADPERIAVFAHSEGSIHVARLVGEKKISPSSLVFMGMVAESPRSLVRWQAVEGVVRQVMRHASAPDRITNEEIARAGGIDLKPSPKGYWTRDELRAMRGDYYESARREALALPDDGVHDGFWSNRWWKMWWSDDRRVADDLAGFEGEIVAHGGDADTKVPTDRQFEILRAMSAKLKKAPKLVLHAGRGHSLGDDGLTGPLAPDSASRLVYDLARVEGVAVREEDRVPELTEEEMAAKPYFGLVFRVSEPLPKDPAYSSEFGIRVLAAPPGFPAWDAGIRVGDVIVRMNGVEPGSNPKEFALARYIRQVQSLKAGEKAAVRLLRYRTEAEAFEGDTKVPAPALTGAELERLMARAEPGKRYRLDWRREHSVLDVTVDIRPPAKVAREPSPVPVADDPVALAARRIAAHYGIEEQQKDLLRRIAEATARPDPFRLPHVDWLQHHPFELGSSSRGIAARAWPVDWSRPAERFLEEARRLLDRGAPEPLAPGPLLTGIPPEDHLTQIRRVLAEADGLRKEAFSALGEADMKLLRETLDGFGRKFEDWNYVYVDDDPVRRDRHNEFLAHAAKVRMDPLQRAAIGLARLTEPAYLRGLKEDLASAGRDLAAREVLAEDTPFGRVVIRGTGDDWNSDSASAKIAVLIDLGGDDVWADRAGASTEAVPLSVAADLEGDDRYESSADHSLGSGLLGVGILRDHSGDDSYLGVRFTQGAAYLGVGVLMDDRGRDTYRAHSYAQGASLFGVAALVDGDGDDRYDSRLLSQGAASGGGAAALLDGSGDDRYFAKGFQGSGYGTPGTFQGWSQGVGIGIRFLASGGVGILADGGGADVFESGDFAQGGGYYYGLGILDSRGESDDVYAGSRYNQGFAAHGGLGAFLERGGNDRYDTRTGVNLGAANDVSVAWFEDGAGNDDFSIRTFAGGASANNAISVFIDRGGTDTRAGPGALAGDQVNDYHGGTSLSLAFDFGARPGGRSPASLGEPAKAAARRGYSFVFPLEGEGFDALLMEGAIEALLPPLAEE